MKQRDDHLRSNEPTTNDTTHGGFDFEELERLGLTERDVVDFSTNVLPHGPSLAVKLAIQSAAIQRYPDRDCIPLRRSIADHYHVPFERILVGNGCSELIHLIASSIVRTGDRVIVVGPTFSEYSRATRLAGGVELRCDALSEELFAVPLLAIESALNCSPTRLVWICNPNNPTGQSIARASILEWLVRFPQTLFVVDESYIEFTTHGESLLECEFPNLIVLRSMTKTYALAGLRLGFAVVPEPWLSLLMTRRIPWSVNCIAQVAGIAALADQNYFINAMRELLQEKCSLMQRLDAHGFQTVPSDAAFFLLEVENAALLRDHLLRQGVLVRDCNSFGLPRHVRIASGTASQNQRLVSCLTGEATTSIATPVKAILCNHWNDDFQRQLQRLFQVRRDVRRFRTDALTDGTMRRLIETACMAPSVGLSQPWRFVSVKSPEARAALLSEFQQQNDLAAANFDAKTAIHYRQLKLAGLREAPEHLAVFVDPNPMAGRGLGRATMPESVAYSVVAAIQNFWLAARVEGLGVGWVSILRPSHVASILNVDNDWQLIAYLCIGYPQETEEDSPELERSGWEQRHPIEDCWFER